jgi:hypothetical protein
VKQERAPDVKMYLPDKSELPVWSASGDPQVARGEDLYLLIDGGAEIFIEYGFKQAIMQSYVNENEKSINLEIYEMDDSSSTFGIYTYRTGEGCEEISIGNDGCFEDYYLNFWKGNFLVTVIGFDSDKETIGGVKTIAKAVEVRIKEGGGKPHLTGILPVNGLKPNGIKYLKGNLALYNNYKFDSANIFGLSEGVIGIYGDHKVFIFSYKDEAECWKWFLNGVNVLETSSDFHEFTKYENGCTMRDRSGNHLRIEPYRNFILIVLRTSKNTKNIMAKQKTMIDHSK